MASGNCRRNSWYSTDEARSASACVNATKLSLLALVELAQQMRHGFELLHRDVRVKDVIPGQFQKCGGLDHSTHEDLVHSRSVRRSAFVNSEASLSGCL